MDSSTVVGEPGSAGVIVPPRLRRLIDSPGPLPFQSDKGQELYSLYRKYSSGFHHRLLNSFAQHCFLGDITSVREAIESGNAPDLLGTETPYRFGYLLLTVFGAQRVRGLGDMVLDHAGILRYLLELGAPPDVPDIGGYTALSHACMMRPRANLARILLEHHADVDHQDRFGRVPLVSAFVYGAMDVIDVLMEFHADLDVKDADGMSPDTLRLKYGDDVTERVEAWKRNRAGETAVAMDWIHWNTCGACGRTGDVSLKVCAKCYAVRYCSRECQREDWQKTHKTECVPFGDKRTTVEVKPFYNDLGRMTNTPDIERRHFGFPVAPQPSRTLKSMQVPELQIGEIKKVILKVQLAIDYYTGALRRKEFAGDMMVYDKKRSIVCRLRRQDAEEEYDILWKTIRTKGADGMKAYFPAAIWAVDRLLIKFTEVLAEQSF